MGSAVEPKLLKLRSGWELPSISPGCLIVEAYLRFLNKPFDVEEFDSARRCPVGRLPALDTQGDVVCAGPGSGVPSASWPAVPAMRGVPCEFDDAISILRYLAAHQMDLDASLDAAQRAQATAIVTMLLTHVAPAVLHCTWVDSASFSSHTRPALGKSLPFPLSWTAPAMQRRSIAGALGHLGQDQIYGEASHALHALQDILAAGKGPYLTGERPSSADAVAYGLVGYLRAAPVTPPDLASDLERCGSVTALVTRIATEHMGAPLPAVTPGQQYTGQGGPRKPKREEPTPAELSQRKYSRMWIAGVAVMAVAYTILGGMITLEVSDLAFDEHEDVDDDDDME
ncbi:unnamed protein product [Pedinophyceae sp. YPF-701]|nr:unnamed protein product [Pedinophyceae sp. YPF-701]